MHLLSYAFLARLLQRLKIIALFVAWFLATGSQWDLVQTFGWGRMVVRYSAAMSVSQAVQRTFSGEMCEVCRAVRQAKQQEQSSNLPPDAAKAKLVMLCPPAPQFVFLAPVGAAWSLSDRDPISAGRPVPPTPPPRVG